MSGRARYQNSSQDTLVRVVGEKEAFCAVNVSCFPSKDLTFGLVGTDRVCERCVVSGRFWLVLFALKVCWLTGVLDFHMVAELVCLELSEK